MGTAPQPGEPGAAFMAWLQGFLPGSTLPANVVLRFTNCTSRGEVESVYAFLPTNTQQDPMVLDAYKKAQAAFPVVLGQPGDPLQQWIKTMLDGWVASIGDIKAITPDQASGKVADITAKALELTAAATAIDLALGALPDGEGFVSSNATRHLLTALGVGAVIAAVAHDPVKMGVLRPYQDNLEATFRNKRPEMRDLFTAYSRRELTPIVQTDFTKITDEVMNTIETDNRKIWDQQIAYYGYSETFANSLARAATITPRYFDLHRMALTGRLDRGFSIYCLWGSGYDKVVIPYLLEQLDHENSVTNYSGYRSVLEAAYVSGDMTEPDLIAYYGKLQVPADIQTWILPRLRNLRTKAAAKALKVAGGRDLTVSQILNAYVHGIKTRNEAGAALKELDPPYAADEIETLLKEADARIKTPASSKLQRLPLSDYEKAYKQGLRTKKDVLDRMAGLYDPRDIALESDLLNKGVE